MVRARSDVRSDALDAEGLRWMEMDDGSEGVREEEMGRGISLDWGLGCIRITCLGRVETGRVWGTGVMGGWGRDRFGVVREERG